MLPVAEATADAVYSRRTADRSEHMPARSGEVTGKGLRMQLRTLSLIVGILATLWSTAGMAHEGHGPVEHPSGLAHYVLSPAHFVSWLGVATVVFLAAAAVRNRLRSLPSWHRQQRKP